MTRVKRVSRYQFPATTFPLPVSRCLPPKKTAAKKAVAKKVSGSDGPTTTAGGAGACNGSAASCSTCGICEQPIINGKDQALFCEGTCKQWIHRFCAGVPLSWFAILGSSSTPFRCYSCCHAKYADDVDSLTTQIKTLKSELGEIKEVVGNLSALSTASQVSDVTGGVSELHCFTSQSDVGVGGRGGGSYGAEREGGFERERWYIEEVTKVLLGDVSGIQQVVVVDRSDSGTPKNGTTSSAMSLAILEAF